MPGDGAPLAKYNVAEVLSGHPSRTNFNVAFIDDRYAVRIAQIEGTFPEHHHDGDESWYVQTGRLRIDSELGSIELRAGEGSVIPAGIRHSPTCLEPGTLVVIVNGKNFTTIPVSSSELAGSGYSEQDAVHAPKPGEQQ
jgi:mannose-6-phosphate isomerase-like protein (cupin superfamily)